MLAFESIKVVPISWVRSVPPSLFAVTVACSILVFLQYSRGGLGNAGNHAAGAIVGKTTRDWSVSGPMYFYLIYILYIAYIYIKNLRVKGNPIFVIRLIQRLLGYLVL